MRYVVKLVKHFHSDSLYRNSIYLMLSTFVMAFFGFFFWIINARLYSADDVGIATILISTMTLISNFALLGLGNGLIRFLPNSINRNDKINTSFTIVIGVTLLLTTIFILLINFFSPSLVFIKNNLIYSVIFILTVIITSVNAVSDNVFVAYRFTKYILF